MGSVKKGFSSALRKKARKGFRGYPVATLALYGPTADVASKLVVAIFSKKDVLETLERLFSDSVDVRADAEIGRKVIDLLKRHKVKSVVITDGIIGCPHEEGVDYPEGESCPECPYWAGRDRVTHEMVH